MNITTIYPCSIDSVREDAARCCDETARWQRGERGPLRTPDAFPLTAEFSDGAFGVASEVALAVAQALKQAGVWFDLAFPWSMAATLLRAGWQREHRLQPHVIRKGAAS